MIRCQHCGAETSNGLALCDLCRRRGADCLGELPIHFRNLARWRRPGRPNGSLGAANQWLLRRGESDVAHVAAALERTSNDLTTWARALADDRDIDLPDSDAEADTEADAVTALCSMLAEYLTSIATLEWAGQFLRDIDRHERALSALTDAYVPGWYAGACRRCGCGTYVVPGITWLTCGGCGATTFARDHLAAVLDEARGWTAPPKRIAEALVALLDAEDSVPRLHDRIRKWESLGLITSVRRLDADGDPVGPKRYQLGDVLDRLDATPKPIQQVTTA